MSKIEEGSKKESTLTSYIKSLMNTKLASSDTKNMSSLMLAKKDESALESSGKGNNGGGNGQGSSGNSSNNGNSNGGNGNGNSNNSHGNGNSGDKGNDKEPGNGNGNGNNPHNPGGDKLVNPEIFQVTNYINDLSAENEEVLMTSDVDGNYRGVYTYDNNHDLIGVEDLGKIEGKPNNPLYYLKDAMGTVTSITNMNGGIIDSNRFAPYGEPLDPVAKNARLTNSPYGFTGESHDIEGRLVYLRARYYEPGTMRFLQQDTLLGDVKEPLTRNLYIYGNANPLKFSGYNDFYDEVFDLATSMDTAKFQFSYDGKDYIFWAWKGDYLNLGAGAEMGIYTRMVVIGTPTEHWLVDQSLAMPMTLTLNYNGKQIISYGPKKDDPKDQNTDKWWVTGFNPYYQNVQASELTATYTIDFSGKEGMYNKFIESRDYLTNKDKWSISKDNKYLLTFTF